MTFDDNKFSSTQTKQGKKYRKIDRKTLHRKPKGNTFKENEKYLRFFQEFNKILYIIEENLSFELNEENLGKV